MADKKISELDLALLINDDAEFPISQDNAGEPTTFKGRITQLGTKIAEDMTFSNLRTTSKKLVGAINELLSLGNPIIIGTTAPTSSIGADGNIYIQYTAGTGSADDEVDALFVKLDGDWCEISTGGGSGTTDYEDLSNKPQVNSVELVGNKSLDDLGIMPASLSKTVSGAIAHFTDGADNIPVKSFKCVIGSDGFSQADITVCGKNLLQNRRTTTTLNGVTFTVNSDGSITLSGTASTSFQFNINNSPLKSAKYTMSNGNTNLISGIALFAVTPSGKKDVNRITGFVTFEDSVSIVALWITSGTNTNGITLKPMIELGETVTEFEAYNSTTYTVEFGQTFNDGMLVYENGEWYVDVSGVITPISSSTIIKTISGENNIFSNTGDVEVNYYTDKADEIVDVAKATASTSLHNYSTDEQIVGTWIDGSTIYEKTFDLASVPLTNATWTNNVLGTSSSNIKIRKFSGTFNISSGGYANEPYADYIYYRSENEYFTAVLNDAGNDLNLRPQIEGVTMTAGVCTIQYTKSST